MSNQTVHQLTENSIAVECPKNAIHIQLTDEGLNTCLTFFTDEWEDIELPEGDWQPLGRGNELTEEQAKSVIVKTKWIYAVGRGRYDLCREALEAFLESENIDPSKVIILVKQ